MEESGRRRPFQERTLHKMKRRLILVVAALVIGGIYLSGGLEFLETRLMDVRFRILKRPARAAVTVVAIDSRSLRRLDVWPWPRGYHATVLETLIEAGAARVAFDLDFSSRSRPEEDTAFAEALAVSDGRVILPIFRQWQTDMAGEGRLVTTAPLAEFSSRATLASINIRPERGGVVRRFWPFESEIHGRTPSMAAALAGAGAGAGTSPFYLDYAIDSGSIHSISYVDLLTGMFDPALIQGRAVIVGATAVELGDQVAVPVQTSLPGPILQALAFESLSVGRPLRRPPPVLLFLVAIATAVGIGSTLARLTWRSGLGLVAAVSGVLFGLSLLIQAAFAVLVDISPLGLTLVAVYGLGIFRRVDQQKVRLGLQARRMRSVAGRMRHVVENSLDAIITVDDECKVETFNAAAEQIFNRSAAEVLGRPVTEIVQGGLPDPSQGSQDAAGSRRAHREGLGIRRDGSTFITEMAVTAFPFHESNVRVVFIRDITERKTQERALKHQATHDALTDLPNRFLLRRRVEEALSGARREGEPVAFLILDLDRFKEVNDTLGHQVGDILLRRIGLRLKATLGHGDTIARLGGDEFAILVPRAGREQARAAAARLIASLRRPFELDSLSLQVDTSIGIAMYPNDGTEATTLIQKADVAMYTAKKARNTLAFYNPEEDFNSIRHLTLKGELREAVERDLFQLYYQPKVSATLGRVVGVEALLRWNHPQHGLLPPGEFIPLAEHTGLIKPITHWVMRGALRQGAAWRAQGLDLQVSINCSARNLLDDELSSAIAGILQSCSFPAERLVLEITETAIIEDPHRALEVVTLLSDLGIRISIDDFGTGYSSLEYLKKLPARELKIDKSFVMSMVENKGDAVIVRSTVDLAHNLGLQAVAEGVDSARVWTHLRQLGCDLGQGYYFARPLPPDELMSWIQTSRWGVAQRPRVRMEEPALPGR